ncbi:MAG: YjfB family protein [Bacillota bacterium]
MIQSIASAASQMKHEAVQMEVGTKVAKMVLDSARTQGDALLEMIEMQKEICTHLDSSVNTWA